MPDALSRDSIPFPLCSKCKENMEIPDSINVVTELSTYRVPTPDELREAQKEQFGDFNKAVVVVVVIV